jgi:hypothetical protein
MIEASYRKKFLGVFWPFLQQVFAEIDNFDDNISDFYEESNDDE